VCLQAALVEKAFQRAAENNPRQRSRERANSYGVWATPAPRGSRLNDKEIVLTQEGLTKLEQELDELKSVHRREVNDRIRQAKEYGDLSENAEYEDAKQEQAFIEGRILKLEAMIRNARIIDESEYVADEVHLGAVVKIREIKKNEPYEFSIVGSAEADPANQRISNESPLGRALMGHKKGTTVDVATPRGLVKYKIESIKSSAPKKAAKKAS
jgi:transcription elongation factor GreA